MGSGGLEFDPVDVVGSARLNQKSTFVGTGAQISGLTTTYAGQLAFCTSTGSGFLVDVLYGRNAANNAWKQIGFFETTEQNTTPITDGADFTATAGVRYYAFFTFPTTEKFYIITKLEWKNGASTAGTIISGVDVVDADPPTIASTPLGALAAEVTQSGASAIQSSSFVSSRVFKGGTIVGIWVSCSSSSATLREQTGLGSQNQSKATSYSSSPGTNEVTAWTTATARKYLKMYYLGYN